MCFQYIIATTLCYDYFIERTFMVLAFFFLLKNDEDFVSPFLVE